MDGPEHYGCVLTRGDAAEVGARGDNSGALMLRCGGRGGIGVGKSGRGGIGATADGPLLLPNKTIRSSACSCGSTTDGSDRGEDVVPQRNARRAAAEVRNRAKARNVCERDAAEVTRLVAEDDIVLADSHCSNVRGEAAEGPAHHWPAKLVGRIREGTDIDG